MFHILEIIFLVNRLVYICKKKIIKIVKFFVIINLVGNQATKTEHIVKQEKKSLVK